MLLQKEHLGTDLRHLHPFLLNQSQKIYGSGGVITLLGVLFQGILPLLYYYHPLLNSDVQDIAASTTWNLGSLQILSLNTVIKVELGFCPQE